MTLKLATQYNVFAQEPKCEEGKTEEREMKDKGYGVWIIGIFLFKIPVWIGLSIDEQKYFVYSWLGIYIIKESVLRKILTWHQFLRTLDCRQDAGKL